MGVGLCLLSLTAVPGLPIYGAIHYDGIASVWDWPNLFNWLAAIAAAMLCGAVYFLFLAPRFGVDIRFRNGGLQVEIRMVGRKVQVHDLTWSEIREIEVVYAGSNRGGVTLRPKNGPIASIPAGLVGVTSKEVWARLRASAEAADHRMELDSKANYFIASRETWRVERDSTRR